MKSPGDPRHRRPRQIAGIPLDDDNGCLSGCLPVGLCVCPLVCRCLSVCLQLYLFMDLYLHRSMVCWYADRCAFDSFSLTFLKTKIIRFSVKANSISVGRNTCDATRQRYESKCPNKPRQTRLRKRFVFTQFRDKYCSEVRVRV